MEDIFSETFARLRSARLEIDARTQNRHSHTFLAFHPRRFDAHSDPWVAAGTISIFSGIAVWRAPDDASRDVARNLLLPERSRSRHRRMVPSHRRSFQQRSDCNPPK